MADVRAPPSPVAMLIATAVLAGISGYMIGIASSLGFLPIPFAGASQIASRRKAGKTSNYDNEEESSEEEIDGDETILDHAPTWTNGEGEDRRTKSKAVSAVKGNASTEKADGAVPGWENSSEECKLVLVVRTDLGMTKGMFLYFPSVLQRAYRFR